MRPLHARDLPNLISLLRLIAVLPAILLLLNEQYGWALLLIVIAGASDGIDGYLAKRFGWQSHLGGILDPLADKVLLISSYLVLGMLGLIPWWLTLAVILRDVVIVTGGLLYHFLIAKVEAAPFLISKLNTLVQILLVLVVLTDASVLALPDAWIQALIFFCLATTVASGFQYVLVWGFKALRAARTGGASH